MLVCMSWSDKSGQHEGYVLPEFADGARGNGSSGGGVPDDQVIVAVEYVGEPGSITGTRYVTRPAAEAIGWRVVCDCRLGDQSSVTNTWSSELIVRVPSSALEDEAAGRIYATDEDVIDAGDAHHGMFWGIWDEQHIAPLEGLAAIARASAAVASAEADLSKAVGAARANGASWEAIGRAAGMTRQAAHSRWSATRTA